MIQFSIDQLATSILEAELPRLAVLANQAHENALKSANTAVQQAIECGQILLRAKAQCKHGEWLPWLQANVQFSGRTVRAYMRLAANWQRAANLPSLREALAQLEADSEPEPETIELLPEPPKAVPATESVPVPPAQEPPPIPPVQKSPLPHGLTVEQLRREAKETKRANKEREKTDPELISWNAWKPVLVPARLFVEGIDEIHNQPLTSLTAEWRAEFLSALRKIAAFIEEFESNTVGQQSC